MSTTITHGWERIVVRSGDGGDGSKESGRGGEGGGYRDRGSSVSGGGGGGGDDTIGDHGFGSGDYVSRDIIW